MRGAAVWAFAGLLCIAACGVKGSPQPALRKAPPPVRQIEIWPREDGNLIKWTVPPADSGGDQTHAAAFIILRCARTPGENAWSKVGKVGTVSAPPEGEVAAWQDRDVKAGHAYRYQVAPVDSNGRMGKESPAVEAQWETPPGAPQDLRAEPGDRSVTLEWDPPTGDAPIEGYFVYRATPGGFERMTDIAVASNSFFDAALQNGETYRYVVRATRLAGTNLIEGPPSKEVEAKPADLIAPQVPVGVDAFPVEGGVLVQWWPNDEPDLAGYIVYRAEKKESVRITAQPIGDAQYLDVSARAGNVYFYTVTAIDNAGNESAMSESARVYASR